jgi:hypothetical protein
LVWPELTLQHDAIGLSLENSSILTFISTSNYAHVNMNKMGGEKMINHTMFHNMRLFIRNDYYIGTSKIKITINIIEWLFCYLIGHFDFSTNKCSLFEIPIFIFAFSYFFSLRERDWGRWWV